MGYGERCSGAGCAVGSERNGSGWRDAPVQACRDQCNMGRSEQEDCVGYSTSGRGGRTPVELRRDDTVCFWFGQVVVVMNAP